MSAETRWKLPDWHQRPVRWVVDGRTPDRVASGDEIDRSADKPHRRSSCLTDYNPYPPVDKLPLYPGQELRCIDISPVINLPQDCMAYIVGPKA